MDKYFPKSSRLHKIFKILYNLNVTALKTLYKSLEKQNVMSTPQIPTYN